MAGKPWLEQSDNSYVAGKDLVYDFPVKQGSETGPPRSAAGVSEVRCGMTHIGTGEKFLEPVTRIDDSGAVYRVVVPAARTAGDPGPWLLELEAVVDGVLKTWAEARVTLRTSAF